MVGWIFTAAQTNDNVSSGFNKEPIPTPSDSLHKNQSGMWVSVKRQSSVRLMTLLPTPLMLQASCYVLSGTFSVGWVFHRCDLHRKDYLRFISVSALVS